MGGEQDSYRGRRRIRELLVRAGLREAASLTFASEADVADGARTRRPGREPTVRRAVPPHEPAPRLLEAASRNRQRGVDPVALFEVGHVFRVGDPVEEREHVAVVLVGSGAEGLAAEDRPLDVLDAKGVVELLRGLGVEWELGPGRSARSTRDDRGRCSWTGEPSAWWARSTRDRRPSDLDDRGRSPSST